MIGRLFQGLLLLALLSALTGCKTVEGDGTAFFLVAEITPYHNDSYILPLHEAEEIARAEAMLAGRESSRIVVARIARGSRGDGYRNKNLLDAGKPSWSWHVTRFIGFADVTAEILDGWPGYVEDNLEAWLAGTDSTVGFWTYRIRRRVAAEEVQ